MIFSYNWLQSFFTKKLAKPEKLAELLTMKAFEVAEVKKIGSDFALDIDVLPNRAPDCFSHLGVAREISAITGLKLREPFSEIKEDKKLKTKDFITLELRDKKACPRYTARVLTDVKVAPSPPWLKNKLRVCGLNSINNIVDIANYVMLETGQPLHAFDFNKLEGKKIIVRFAQNRERIVTLDEQKFDLDPAILVIADAKKPVAIAGIKGGKMPEIDKKTKTVVLESANFNSQTIRQASQQLNLKTDASLRFEHGLDPNLTELASNLAAFLIQKVAGGKIAQGLIDIYPKKVYPKRIKLDLNYVESLLGVKILAKNIKTILQKLGFKIMGLRNPLLVEVPTRRLDVVMPEDLIEEIGRLADFEKIPAKFPIVALLPAKKNEQIFWENIAKDILKEAGFSEVYNYSFIDKEAARIFNHQDLIELENPVSREQQYLRPSLIPNLLKNVEKNLAHSKEIKIFELGKVFQAKDKETRELAGLVTGEAFYQLKGVVDTLLNKLGISNIWYDDYRSSPEASKLSLWQPKKCAEIKVDHTAIGFLGELKNRGVVAFDIDFEKLQRLVSEEKDYRPISRFPVAVRDMAILVPWQVRVEEVLNKIEVAGRKLIRDIDLFDIYQGEELPQGKKNLAFHIIYQAADRTLTSKEVNDLHQKIIKTLEKNPGWQVRK